MNKMEKEINLEDINLKIKFYEDQIRSSVEALSLNTIPIEKLIYLAPTMSPGPSSIYKEYIEDPITTSKWMFENVSNDSNVVLNFQEKKMGSRCTWLAQKSKSEKKWNITSWSRNGYNIFKNTEYKNEIYSKLQYFLNKIEYKLGKTNLILLDSEILPWNFLSENFIDKQFMNVFNSGYLSAKNIYNSILKYKKFSEDNKISIDEELLKKEEKYLNVLDNFKECKEIIENYCWKINSSNDIKISFFDILAYGDKIGHEIFNTQEETIRFLNFISSDFDFCDLIKNMIIYNNEKSLQVGFDWWKMLTNNKSEGVVIKYNDKKNESNNKFPQKMLKCRGQKYLKIIYGENYLQENILKRIKSHRNIKYKMEAAWKENLLSKLALKNYLSGKKFYEWHKYIIFSLASEFIEIDSRL